MAHRSPQDAKAQVEPIRAILRGDSRIARYVGEAGAGWDPFPSQVAKVYQELTGNALAALVDDPPRARHAHARAHGLALA
jgi:hypothetical protein